MRLPILFLFLSVLFSAGCDSSALDTPDVQENIEQEQSTTLRKGNFIPNDGAGKEAMGSATLVKVSESLLRVDFSETFSLTPGPSLFVFLSNSEFPSDDAVNLGSFKSPQGAQMYSVPAGITLDSFTHVVVYCVPYKVMFAFAELK